MEKEQKPQRKASKASLYKKELADALAKAKTKKQKQSVRKDIFVRVLAEEQVAGNVFVACQWLKFDRRHMYRLKATDAKFSKDWKEAIIQGEGKVFDIMENTLYRRAISGHVTALIFTLKNRRPARWTDRRSFDGGSPNKPIPVKHTYGTETFEWLKEEFGGKKKKSPKKNEK